jgi:3-hydroxyisobutyrate dehydrogenase-like beta-hydroxyacid dehydrogenase
MKKLVGMIGVGLMGQGIAKNLVKKGCSLAFLDHPGNQPIDELVAAGARVFPDAATVARNADVVILCVTGAPEVESVLTGEKGVLDGIRPGSIVVDCTTSLPGTSVKMAMRRKERSICWWVETGP